MFYILIVDYKVGLTFYYLIVVVTATAATIAIIIIIIIIMSPIIVGVIPLLEFSSSILLFSSLTVNRTRD